MAIGLIGFLSSFVSPKRDEKKDFSLNLRMFNAYLS